ncbi:DUF7673 family protein [Bradyrhizobium roseum]|uniref:DUF7673 family protein n=1 Tax=Bradyrhizobium roseum TaxID=3056648 RepID=UPI00262CFB23|nr:hypothetical protein [Bradyrhizobium roseus]WKA31577.1 hypothetical protein QUH67_16080 [Bradyrhizobium roseus]
MIIDVDLLKVSDALERLVKIAHGDTGQSRLVADFLLAWWNPSRDGGFHLTDLWNVDQAICDDMMVVFAYIAKSHCYPDGLGVGPDFEAIVLRWRRQPRRPSRKAVRG